MDNAFPGSRWLGADREDIARLDFIEGARGFAITKVRPAAYKRNLAIFEDAFSPAGAESAPIEEIRRAVDGQLQTRTNSRMLRTVQDMIWETTFETVHRRESDLLAELDRADRSGPGSVEYNPDFHYPAYFTNHEFHLQRGGYANPLAGYVYHLGGNVFHSGRNERAEANAAIVNSIPAPPDGRVRRVLELGCSVGGSTTALKERFPDAEVWGTDITAAMVRYAHKRAVDMGCDIHFKQMAAEAISFPDNTFDLIFANIVFHELPAPAARQSVAECLRVLRPGGIVAFADIQDHTLTGSGPEMALARYSTDWQVEQNGEKYYGDFFDSDLAGVLRDAGFRNVVPSYVSNSGTWSPNLALPIRVGEK